MNNETRILSMSLLAVLDGFEKSIRSSISETLKELREFNQDTEETIDDDGEKITKTVIRDEKLQKVILSQEKELKTRINERENRVGEVMRKNSDKIKIIEEILREVLEKPKDTNNIF